jgi:hypothetical protein
VAAHKIQLKFAKVRRGNMNVGKLAKAGVYSVNGAAVPDDLLDYRTRPLNSLDRIFRQSYVLGPVCHRGDFIYGELLTP